MELENKCLIRKKDNFQACLNDHLYLLYAPLIKDDACMLYGLLTSLDHCDLSIKSLLMLYGGHINCLDSARKVLEQFELIKTYYDENLKTWLFEIYAPLDAYHFFRHDTFSRLFLNECGSGHYDFLKRHFTREEVSSNFVDVSAKLDYSRLDSWNDQKEKTFLDIQPREHKLTYDFDFNTFLNGADRIFPLRYRTKENLAYIAQLASIHGISALDMRKYVQRSINPNTHVFDLDKLKQQVYANRSIMDPTNDPYQMSPVQFLVHKQKGAPVASADKKLIEKLLRDYKFSNEVMNSLIEYCLDQTNQQFSKAYVEKVAASWVRLKITTKAQADALAKQETKQPTKALPDWYASTSQTKPNDELIQEVLELQKQLKGED